MHTLGRLLARRGVRRAGRFLVAMTAAVLFSQPLLRAQITVTKIPGPVGGTHIEALAISGNNVVGSYVPSGVGYSGFAYSISAGTFTTIPPPTGGFIYGGFGNIAVSGDNAVGSYEDNDGNSWGFVYNIPGKAFTEIPPPMGTVLLNAVGVSGDNVVGVYNIENDAQQQLQSLFVYNLSSEVFTPINPEPGYPTAIDGANVVGGYSGSSGDGAGFVYNISSEAFIEIPAPGTVGVANGVSGDNVVGSYEDSNSHTQGFVYNISTGTFTTIPAPNGSINTSAYGVSGENVVGRYAGANGDGAGFVYNITSGVFTTISAPAGSSNVSADAIDGANVVGSYTDSDGDEQGFVATLPGTLALVMHRATSVTNGTAAAGVDVGLIPAPDSNPIVDPDSLAAQPAVTNGLIADGVTPLILEYDQSGGSATPVGYKLSVGTPTGGSVTGLELQVLSDGKWAAGTTALEISSTQPGFAYIEGIKPEALIYDLDSTEVDVPISIQVSGQSTPATTFTIRIRKPPIVLVHGFNVDTSNPISTPIWGPNFVSVLNTDRGADFVAQIAYAPKANNIADRFDTLAQDLDDVLATGSASVATATVVNQTGVGMGQLTGAVEDPVGGPFAGWAFTRYDLICHSQGGVLARMLCTTTKSAPDAEGTPFGTIAFRSFENNYRGRFRRIVTIGSPQNGARLVHYLLNIENSPGTFSEGQILSVFRSIAPILQDKFDPFLPQIQAINSTSLTVDPNAKFHLISTTIAGGVVPGLLTSAPIYAIPHLTDTIPGLTYTRGQIVLGGKDGASVFPDPDVEHGGGSDGIVDVVSQQGGTGNSTIVSAFTAHDEAHSGPTALYGVPTGQNDTADAAMATLALGFLDEAQPAKGLPAGFGAFKIPTLLTAAQKTAIDAVTPQFTILDDILPTSGLTDARKNSGVKLPAGSGTSSSYTFSITPGANLPVQGTVTWTAEVYAPGGITTTGVTVTPDPTDSTQVTVTVANTVVGEVALDASYTATNGEVVFSQSTLVVSVASGATQTGISLSPSPATVIAGESVALELDEAFNDATTQPAFLTDANPAQFSSTNTNVLSVDSTGLMHGVAPGQVTVNASFGGFSTQATVTVAAAGLGPQITSAGTGTATFGVPFSYQITALQSPTSFNASSLPSWLNVNTTTGVIYGTPTATGPFPVVMTAANAANQDSEALVITVNPAAQTVTFPVIPAQNAGEGSLTLGALASSGLAVTFAVVSGPATISGDVLTFTGAGTVVVSATQAGNSNYKAATTVKETIKVAAAPAKTAQTITFGAIGNQTAGTSITLGATASSELAVTYVVSGPAKLSHTTLTFTGAGVVSVTAAQAGNTTYAGAASVARVFDVVKAVQTITFPAIPSPTFGEAAVKLTATSSSNLAVTYKVDLGPAKVSGSTLSFTGAGTVVVEADQAGNTIYAAAPAVQQILTVAQEAQTIAFPAIANKVLGAAPFAVTATATSKLAVTFSVASGPATISGSKVTLTGTGMVTIRASQAGNANFAPATSVSESFTVTPKS